MCRSNTRRGNKGNEPTDEGEASRKGAVGWGGSLTPLFNAVYNRITNLSANFAAYRILSKWTARLHMYDSHVRHGRCLRSGLTFTWLRCLEGAEGVPSHLNRMLSLLATGPGAFVVKLFPTDLGPTTFQE